MFSHDSASAGTSLISLPSQAYLVGVSRMWTPTRMLVLIVSMLGSRLVGQGPWTIVRGLVDAAGWAAAGLAASAGFGASVALAGAAGAAAGAVVGLAASAGLAGSAGFGAGAD